MENNISSKALARRGDFDLDLPMPQMSSAKYHFPVPPEF